MAKNQDQKKTRGPKPEVLKIEEGHVDWKDAMRHVMGKPKPKREDIEGESDE